MIGRFLAPCPRIWLLFGLDLAPWQKVDLVTLLQATVVGVFPHVTRAPTEGFFTQICCF